jgi:hypothetical protein
MNKMILAFYGWIYGVAWSVRGLDNWMAFLFVCFLLAHGAWTIGATGFIFAWAVFGAITYFFLSMVGEGEEMELDRYILLWPLGFVSTSARRWIMSGPFLSRYRHAIRNFHYDGIGGSREPGYAPYTAEFIRWTSDPGIAEMKCSDGRIRLIPGWAIDSQYDLPPMPDYRNMARNLGFMHIGTPAHS